MTALIIILAVIFLIAVTKVGISAAWNESLSLRLQIGPASFSLLREKKQSKEKPVKTTAKKQKGNRPWGKLILQHWREVLSLISKILRAPKLDRFSLQVLFGGKDHADAALNYGKACAAAGFLLPFLKSLFQIDENDIQILYDAEVSELSCKAAGAVTVRIYQLPLLAIALLRFAYTLYKELPNSQKVV